MTGKDRIAGVFMLAAFIVLPVFLPLRAAETVLLNESFAYECYRAAVRGDVDIGVEACSQAIEYQTLGTEDLAATYSNRGLLLSRDGELKDALKDHEKAISIAPELGSLYVNRSNTYVRAKRMKDAMADLEQAISIADESLAAAYYNRALLFQRLGDGQAARADAERAAELSPETEAYRQYLSDLNRPVPVSPQAQ
jgi:tetratricopeptide (TPR) repeat protein